MSNFILNPDGYIANTGAVERIQPEFIPLLNELVIILEQRLALELMSIYVRGSISVGKAFPFSSDADLVVVTRHESLHRQFSFTLDALLQKYPLVTDIELTIIDIETLLHGLQYNRLRVYLATQSALLSGEEILRSLPRFKPNRELALYLYPNIESQFRELRQILTDETKDRSFLGRDRSTKFWCVWTMRTLLRAANALSMVKNNLYECELRACLENSVAVYPEMKEGLDQAYHWALQPIDRSGPIVNLLDNYLPLFLRLWQSEVIQSSDQKD